ncbi:hypothetical protein ACEWY4_021996 [Coilia grayii]|uniref:Ribosomal protein S6 kinase delta-1 n=1 Tax=Coilia grayii TaxID=363190 RepID=A0ABD1J4T8_9TELE
MISQREKGELARFYTVTDPRKHEKGYTVYKVTARIISRKNPEDIQEIVVWKRYSDFRKLHRDLWQIHRNLYRHSHLFPPFAKATLFGRFDDSVIEERRQCSEDLLQFSANIPALYSSQHIEDFFKDGEVQDGSELIGPAEPFSDFLADSLSNCSSEVQRDIGGVDDLTSTSQTDYGGPSSESELTSLQVDEDSLAELDNGMASGGDSPNHTPPPGPSPAPSPQLRKAPPTRAPPDTVQTNRTVLFPNALKKRRDYLDRAGELIRLAAQKEEEGDVEAALSHYRGGVDLLLQGVQGEVSPSRREAVKRKTAEYLMHAEQLSNQHAHIYDIMGQSSTQSAVLGSQCCRPSWSQQSQCDDLNNYRVLGVIDKVLLVMDKRTQETFILKGLRKSSECGRVRKTIVPHSVPHMVPLRKIMLAEDSIFLLLDYAEGGKLWWHISKYLRSGSSPDESLDIPFIQKSHTAAVHCAPQPPLLHSSGSADSGGPQLQRGGEPLSVPQRGSLRLGEGGIRGGLEGGDGEQVVQEEEEEEGRCTNSYLTLCNEYEQEKVEGGEDEEEEEGEMQEERNGLGVTNRGASSIMVAMPMRTPPTKLLLSNDSLSSAVVGQEAENEVGGLLGGCGCGRGEEVFSPVSEPISSDSLDQSKRSPMELFRIDSKDSASEVLCYCDPPSVAPGNDPHLLLSTSDLGSEVTMGSLLDLAEVVQVKGHMADQLWRFDNDCASNESVPVISFTEAVEGGGKGGEEARPPDLLVNLPGVGVDVAGDPLEAELVAAGVALAIEARLSPKMRQPDVLQLEHDVGEEACPDPDPDPDWSLEQDSVPFSLSSLGPTHSSTGDSLLGDATLGLSCSCSPPELPGAKMAARSKMAAGSNMADGDRGSSDFPPSSTNLPLLLADPSEASGRSHGAGSERGRTEGEVSYFGSGSDSGANPGPHGSGWGSDSGMEAGQNGCESGPDPGRNQNVSQLFRELDELSMAAAQVRIPEEFVRRWAAELVIALDTLHQQGLICRDLNPNNLLLNDTGHIQLTFFCSWSEVEESYDRDAIAKMYCAPEVGGISEETVACDWWSLGAILFELLTGKALHQCHPAGISRHTFLSIPEFVSEEARSLLQQLLQYNPAERLGAGVSGAEDIKSHPFFSGVTWPK